MVPRRGPTSGSSSPHCPACGPTEPERCPLHGGCPACTPEHLAYVDADETEYSSELLEQLHVEYVDARVGVCAICAEITAVGYRRRWPEHEDTRPAEPPAVAPHEPASVASDAVLGELLASRHRLARRLADLRKGPCDDGVGECFSCGPDADVFLDAVLELDWHCASLRVLAGREY